MIEITIRGMYEAMQLAQENVYTKIISLVDINSKIVSLGPNHLIVTVTDMVEMPERFKGPYVNPAKKPVLPAMEHLDQVLAHTADMKDSDSLLIHCAAGKSRSTAMAIAVLIQHGMTPQDAMDHVESIRPIMLPNQLMMSLIDEKFGYGGKMFEAYTAWYHEKLKSIVLF